MIENELATAAWRKATASGGTGGDCVRSRSAQSRPCCRAKQQGSQWACSKRSRRRNGLHSATACPRESSTSRASSLQGARRLPGGPAFGEGSASGRRHRKSHSRSGSVPYGRSAYQAMVFRSPASRLVAGRFSRALAGRPADAVHGQVGHRTLADLPACFARRSWPALCVTRRARWPSRAPSASFHRPDDAPPPRGRHRSASGDWSSPDHR